MFENWFVDQSLVAGGVGRICRHWTVQPARLQPAKSVLLSASIEPISASVLTTAGWLSVTNPIVFIDPTLVLAFSQTVSCVMLDASVVGHQARRLA